MSVRDRDPAMIRSPLVVILGATGTGKSKLAVEIAKKFTGEVISADSMQVYRGLDVLQNKVTEEEMEGVPHHLLGVLEPGRRCTVLDFRNMALPIIRRLHEEGKLPVVVGGTNYYIESLVWKVLVEGEGSPPREPELGVVQSVREHLKKRKLDSFEDSEDLYRALQEVDPERASHLHPNDIRKIVRSLEVFLNKGVKHSDILAEQRANVGSSLGGPLRYTNTAIIWLTADQEVLEERLDSRTADMLSRGLVEELEQFYDAHIRHESNTQYTSGVLQSIGLKEMSEYLGLGAEERASPVGKAALDRGLSLLRLATKRYAKRQNKWVRRRFLATPDRQVPPVYQLDTSDVSLWEEKVGGPAEALVASLMGLEGTVPPLPLPHLPPEEAPPDHRSRHHCPVCQRVFIGEVQWKDHIKSKRHEKVLKKAKLLEKMEVEKKEAQQSDAVEVSSPP